MKSFTKHPQLCVFFLFIYLMSSCTSDFEGPFPQNEHKPTVNATLAADSLIQIKLSWPRKPGDTSEFEPINNARISLWENDSLLGQASEDPKGNYILEHTINPGCSYRMEATIDKWGNVSAETFVPHDIKCSITKEENPLWEWEWDKSHYRLTLGTYDSKTAGIWVTATLMTEDSIPGDQAFQIASNTPLADNFNKSWDTTVPEGYFSLYESFMRIGHENLQSDSTSLTFKPHLTSSGKDEFIFILTAGEDYDQYFRALWRDKEQNEAEGLNPFTFHPQFPYSNINNGYGIFAGYNIQRFHF